MTSNEDNLARQRALYGEPLAVIAGRITALGVTQARLAEVLGLSAPMLSQLLSGHRVKIGNPLVLARLRALSELAGEAPGLDAAELASRLEQIRESAVTISDSGPRDLVVETLRGAASAAELARMAELTTAASLASLLRAAARPADPRGADD